MKLKKRLDNNTVFVDYAQFYDALYQDKDYQAECNYLEKIFRKFATVPIKNILNLGCGTGSHDLLLAKRGFHITGIDLSPAMLKIAKRKASQQKIDIRFLKADIRFLQLNKRFDAVLALFAVIGYQTANHDLVNTFRSAHKHLRPGGIFVFDIWFGPAVLKQKPQVKIKKVKMNLGFVQRQTKPYLDILGQIVSVCFETKFFQNQKLIFENRETHRMRFFFYQELKILLEQTGFRSIYIFPFMKLKGKPNISDWNIIVIAQR